MKFAKGRIQTDDGLIESWATTEIARETEKAILVRQTVEYSSIAPAFQAQIDDDLQHTLGEVDAEARTVTREAWAPKSQSSVTEEAIEIADWLASKDLMWGLMEVHAI